MADWVETTEAAEDATDVRQQAFEVIQQMPTQVTARVKAISEPAKASASKSAELDLKSFPPLLEGEPKELRSKRLEAYLHCWQGISAHVQEVLEATNKNTFKELADLAFQQHISPIKRRTGATRRRVIPTALTVAGSVNSADHSKTFPGLVAQLRGQGCYAALLGPCELASGAIGPALMSTLRQFSGLQTEADDMQALLAWYSDELEARAPREVDRVLADTLASPMGKMGLATPSKPAGRRRIAELRPEGADAIASPFGKISLVTPQRRKLRNRASPESPEAAAEAADSAAPAVGSSQEATEAGAELEASQRPLVIVIEGAEGVDPLVMQDLITVVSENHSELPITLMLGMATSAAALTQMLPAAAADMLAPRNFRLVRALERLEAVVREVLLGSRLQTVFFGHRLLRALDDDFMLQDFTVGSVERGLQVACIGHFQRSILSFLAVVPADDVRSSCLGLPPALLASTASDMGLTQGTHTNKARLVGDAVLETRRTWSAWAVALHWMNAAALALGHKANGFSLRELVRDASEAGFAESVEGRKLLHTLQVGLLDLSPQAWQDLVRSLRERAQCVWGGLEAVTKHLDAAAGLVEDCVATGAAASAQENSDPNVAHAPDPEEEPTQAAGRSQPEASTSGVAEVSKPRGKVQSAAGRRQALLSSLQACNIFLVKPSKGTVRGASGAEASERQLAKELTTVFLEAVRAHISKTPTSLPGAAILCCEDKGNGRRLLTSAPRVAIHNALARPEIYLQGVPEGMGLSPDWDDACIAYKLLLEYGEDVDVEDWFNGFCVVHRAPGAETVDVGAQEPSPRKKAKRPRGRASKKVLQNPEADAAAAEKSRGVRRPGRPPRAVPVAPEPQSQEELVQAHEEPNPSLQLTAPVAEFAARFSQAAKELQLLGLLRPARKRRGFAAQRMVWGSGRTRTEGEGCAS